MITLIEYHIYSFRAGIVPSENGWAVREGDLFQLLAVKWADGMEQAYEKVKGHLAELDEMKSKAEDVVQGQCFTLKDLSVNGRDVIAVGIAPDPEVGQILNKLLKQVLNGEVSNEQKILLNLIRHK